MPSDGADLTYVVNSLYYSFYYPLIGLLQARGIAAATQSVTIALFDAIREAFELKPKCSGGALTVPVRNEVDALLGEAEVFTASVSRAVGIS